MSKKEPNTNQGQPSKQTYICKVRPLSSHEKETLKIRIMLSIGQLAENP